MLIMLVSIHWNLTPVSGRVSDMVFLDDTNPLTGSFSALIDTAICEASFIDALVRYDPPACDGAPAHNPAGRHCAYDPFVDAGSAGDYIPYHAPKG